MLCDISLLIEDKPLRLALAHLCQLPPSLQGLWVSLVAVSSFGLFPVALGEVEKRRDSLVGHVPDERADGARLCRKREAN